MNSAVFSLGVCVCVRVLDVWLEADYYISIVYISIVMYTRNLPKLESWYVSSVFGDVDGRLCSRGFHA